MRCHPADLSVYFGTREEGGAGPRPTTGPRALPDNSPASHLHHFARRAMSKIIRSSPALLLVLCFSGTGVTPAHACSCIGPSSACEAFWGTPVVFLGTAVDVHVKWSGFGDDKHSYVEEHRSA